MKGTEDRAILFLSVTDEWMDGLLADVVVCRECAVSDLPLMVRGCWVSLFAIQAGRQVRQIDRSRAFLQLSCLPSFTRMASVHLVLILRSGEMWGCMRSGKYDAV